MSDYDKATCLRKDKKFQSAIDAYSLDWKATSNSASLAGILNCLRHIRDNETIENGLDIIDLILAEDFFVDWCENEIAYFLATVLLKKDSGFKDFDRLNHIFGMIAKKFKSKEKISYIASKMSNYYSDKQQFKFVKRLRKYVQIEDLENDTNKEWSDKITYVYRLNKCFLEEGDFDIDFEVLPELVKSNPKSELHLMRLYAQYIYKQGNNDEALKIYLTLEKFKKDYIMNEIGEIYYHKKEFSEAAKYYIESILITRHYDKKYTVLKKLANCFLVLKMNENAFYTYALILNNKRFHNVTSFDADLNITYLKLKEELKVDELPYSTINREFRNRCQRYIELEEKREVIYSGKVERLVVTVQSPLIQK